MANTAKIESTLAQLRSRLQGNSRIALSNAMLRACQVVAGHIRREIQEWTSATDYPKTGALMRSFRPTILSTGPESYRGGVFSDLPYAAIHEYGGTIKSRGKLLAIPLTNTARRVNPREFPGRTFVVKSKLGNLLIVRKRSARKGGIEPLYLLRDSVTITPKRYLERAEYHSAKPAVEVFIKAVRALVRRSI